MILSSTFGFLEGLGGPEMVVIFIIVLILFGGNKMPEFARGLGKTIREFKKAASGVEEEFKRALEEEDRKNRIAPPTSVAQPVTPAHAIPQATEPLPPVAPSALLHPPAPAAETPPPPKMMPREDDGHFS